MAAISVHGHSPLVEESGEACCAGRGPGFGLEAVCDNYINHKGSFVIISAPVTLKENSVTHTKRKEHSW